MKIKFRGRSEIRKGIVLCDEVSEKISAKKKIEGGETQGGAPLI